MMKKLTVLTALLLVAVAPAAAQAVEPSPGLIGASNPAYGLELAFDDVAMAVGVANPGDIAVERAAEAQQASEDGDSEAAEQAIQAMERATNRATEQDREKLDVAESVLQRVKGDLPSEASQGINTAIENIQQAKRRPSDIEDNIPEDVGQFVGG